MRVNIFVCLLCFSKIKRVILHDIYSGMQEKRFMLQRIVADKAGYEFLAEFYAASTEVQAKNIYVDFAQCQQVDANLSAVLGAYLDKMVKDGHDVFIIGPKSRKVKQALSRNNFFRAFDYDTNCESRENYIEYRDFGVHDTSEFKRYIDIELTQKERFPSCSEKVKLKIIESIYEIFANAVSHGGCERVYCCGEVHNHRNRTMLDITFVNLGRTVVENVNDFLISKGKRCMMPCDALRWAFIEGNTTKHMPGGLGLAILKEFIGMNEGAIQMVSGNAMLEINGNESEYTTLDNCFPGTIVTVEFNCDDDKTYITTEEVPDVNDLF